MCAILEVLFRFFEHSVKLTNLPPRSTLVAYFLLLTLPKTFAGSSFYSYIRTISPDCAYMCSAEISQRPRL